MEYALRRYTICVKTNKFAQLHRKVIFDYQLQLKKNKNFTELT